MQPIMPIFWSGLSFLKGFNEEMKPFAFLSARP